MRAAATFACFLLALPLLSVPATAGGCLKAAADGQIAEGRLVLGRFKDAAGRPETAYILLLSQPACLDADEADERVDKSAKIHIFSSRDSIHRQIHSFVGKIIQVRGSPAPALTVHHHAAIIMDIAEIDQK